MAGPTDGGAVTVEPLALADAILFQLVLRGAVLEADLTHAVGERAGVVAAEIERLGAAGLIERRAIGGREQLVATASGRERARTVIEGERVCLGAAVAAIDDAFADLNRRVKHVLLRWQVRLDRATQIPNDHSDVRYDRAVLADLQALHASADQILARLAPLRPRYASLRRRLREALARALHGDRAAVAGVTGESFHAAWWELHADLLAVLGRARGDADA